MNQVDTKKFNPAMTLVASCLGFVVVILDVSVVNVATDALSKDFGATTAGLEWVINGYALTFAALLLTAGALGDRIHPKRIFQLGFALFAVTSLICGAAPNLLVLVIARIFQGIGAALIVPSSLSLVNQAYSEPNARTKAVSLWAAAGGLSLALGPVVGGVLISTLGWRSIFLINIPIALIGIWIIARHAPSAVPRAAGERRSIDPVGQVLAVVMLGALTTAIIEATPRGWSDGLVLSALAVFAVGLIALVAVEARNADPMLPLGLFRHAAFSASSAIGVLLNFAFYGLIFVFSRFFQQVWDYSPILTGLAFLPMMGTIMAANLACGPLSKRYGALRVLVVGAVFSAVGYLAMVPAIESGSYAVLLIQFVIAGWGIGLMVPSATNTILSSVHGTNVGIASGVLNASRQIGGLLGVAVMGMLAGEISTSGPNQAFTDGLRTALVWAGIALAISAVLGLIALLRTRRLIAASAPTPPRHAAAVTPT